MTPGHAVLPIDLCFQGLPGVITTYVITGDDGPVIIDPGPSSTLPTLRAGLAAHGLDLRDVRHVVLTHIHLDHAGATGSIVHETGARVYVHARGAPHLARPERLMASAGQIYREHMHALWGEMRPVPPELITALSGGEDVQAGSVTLQAIASPGHAVHHLAWQCAEHLFCGDAGGIRLEAAQTPRAPTPPPDINLEAWRESVARLRSRDARVLHVAHAGSYTDPAAHWDALLANMETDAQRVRSLLAAGATLDEVTDDFTRQLEADLAGEGGDLAARMRFASPAWMSVQGLARYWQKREARLD